MVDGGEGGGGTGLVEVGAAGSFNLSAIFLRTDPSIFRIRVIGAHVITCNWGEPEQAPHTSIVGEPERGTVCGVITGQPIRCI